MNSYFVNISDEYLKNKEDQKRRIGRNENIQYKSDKNVLSSYKERYRYNQELRQGLQRPVQKKKRKHKVSRHRKETYSEHFVPSGSDDDEVGHEIPTIEHIRLAGATRRKLLERRISLLKERDQHTNVESRFSDRELKALSVYHPSSSHSSHHTRTLHTAILENEAIRDADEYGATMKDAHKAARHHRTSVLKKAERLLYERKRLEIGSSSEADAEDSPRVPSQPQQQRLARPSTYVARRSRSRSLSSEREYINVPEIFDPTVDNNDLPLRDLDSGVSAINFSDNRLQLPDNSLRLHSNGGSVKSYGNSKSPVPLHSNDIRLHSKEGSVRNYGGNNRLDFLKRDNRLSSTESRVRQYIKSAAQVR